MLRCRCYRCCCSSVKNVQYINLCLAVNAALLRTAIQSSTWEKHTASLAVDGNLNTFSCTDIEITPWWSVDLGTPRDVGRVCITNDRHPAHGEAHLYNRCLTAFYPTPWMRWTGRNSGEGVPTLNRDAFATAVTNMSQILHREFSELPINADTCTHTYTSTITIGYLLCPGP